MRHGDAADAAEVDGITPITKINADNLAFLRVHRVRVHFNPVTAKCRNFKAFIGIRLGGEMHIAAPRAKGREQESIALAVIPATTAVKVARIKFPLARLGLGIGQ